MEPTEITIPTTTSLGAWSLREKIEEARQHVAEAIAIVAEAKLLLLRDTSERMQIGARSRLDNLFAQAGDCEATFARALRDLELALNANGSAGRKEWVGTHRLQGDDIPF